MITRDDLQKIIDEHLWRVVGKLPGEDTYTLLCPAHYHPEYTFAELADAIADELYRRSLRGRIADRWYRLLRHLPYRLVLLLSREERAIYRAHRHDPQLTDDQCARLYDLTRDADR